MPAGDKGYQMFRSKLSLRGIVVIAALTMSGGSGLGQGFTANDVMVGCRIFTDPNNNSKPYDQGTCAGMIAGISYMGNGAVYCAPSGVTMGQQLRVAVQYIDARPTRTHEDFRKLALEALKAAWPCQR
jgi:hypothetical protein